LAPVGGSAIFAAAPERWIEVKVRSSFFRKRERAEAFFGASSGTYDTSHPDCG
jgi:hypothetical protein